MAATPGRSRQLGRSERADRRRAAPRHGRSLRDDGAVPGGNHDHPETGRQGVGKGQRRTEMNEDLTLRTATPERCAHRRAHQLRLPGRGFFQVSRSHRPRRCPLADEPPGPVPAAGRRRPQSGRFGLCPGERRRRLLRPALDRPVHGRIKASAPDWSVAAEETCRRVGCTEMELQVVSLRIELLRVLPQVRLRRMRHPAVSRAAAPDPAVPLHLDAQGSSARITQHR